MVKGDLYMALMNRESVSKTPIIKEEDVKVVKETSGYKENTYYDLLYSRISACDIKDICDDIVSGRVGAIR